MWERSHITDQMANIKDIAKLANVSKSTVSRVVSNKGYVKPETRERIEQVMEELKYRPNMFAKGMRTNRSFSIGILFPDLANPFFSVWYEIVDRISRELGYLNYICITDPDGESEEKRLDDLLARKIDGIIVFSYTKNLEFWNKLEIVSKHTPIVCCDPMFEGRDLTCVYSNARSATKEAVHHLYNSGKRRIAYVKGSDKYEVVRDRYEGYRDGLTELNLDFNESLVFGGELKKENGIKAAQYFMHMDPMPDAIMASTDIMAIGVLEHLNKNQVKVPDQIAVFGFNSLPNSKTTNPPLSTVGLPIQTLAETTAKTLLDLIADPSKKKSSHVFECDLKIRESA